jgi:membrane-associated phospholipid phosphatase
MSGHSTASFTLAGLTCIHHAYLPLYGGGAPDALACAGSMAAATTVAMMRVVSDQHYLSDVIIGSAFGALAGVGMPWLLHYRGGGSADQTAPPDSKHYKISATVMPTPNGIFVMGTF